MQYNNTKYDYLVQIELSTHNIMPDDIKTDLPDSEKFDTLEKYILWMETKVNSIEQYMTGKDPNEYPCMECSRNELRSALAKIRHVKSLK